MRIRCVLALVTALGAAIWMSEAPAARITAQVRMSPVDLVQTTLTAPGKIKIGKKVRIMDELESVGESTAAMSVTYFYLSKDDTIDATDIVVAARRVPPLPAGTTQQEFTTVVLPDTVEPGPHYLIALCNATKTVDERYLDNNTRATKVTVEPADPKKKSS